MKDSIRRSAGLGLAIAICLLAGHPAAATAAGRGAEAEPIRLTVVGTSDFHGALEARHAKVVGGRKVGGIAMIAAHLNAVRRDNPGGVIHLDGGDLYQGTLLSAASEGRAVVDFYNALGVDAVAVGNHDFDFGPVGYHSVPEKPDEDPFGVLKQRIAQAEFPFLSANIIDRETGKPPEWPGLASHTMLERKGLKIGVIGLTSVDTSLTTHPANVRGLEFRPLLVSLERVLPEVRRAGADLVLLLIHAGVTVDERSGKVSGPVAELLRALEPGTVDLVVGGHSHMPFCGLVAGVPVLQSWPNGLSFARAELFVDPDSRRAMPKRTVLHGNTFYHRCCRSGQPIQFLGTRLQPDKRFGRQLEVFRRAVAHLQRVRLGRSLRDLPNRTDLDSPVGNLVTDAMRAADPEIEIAMYNSGGLRTSIPKGEVTFGLIYEVVPFDNSLVKVTLTGAQVREVIEHGLSAPYGVMEISGLEVEIDPDRQPGQRCRSIRTGDGPLEPDRLYVVGTNEFLLNGGDGYYTFARGRDVEHTHTLIRELVARYIKQRGTVAPDMGGRYRPAKSKGESQDL